MIELIINYAPTIGLLFFFSVFLGIAVWVLRPSVKHKLQELGNIPLMEDKNG